MAEIAEPCAQVWAMCHAPGHIAMVADGLRGRGDSAHVPNEPRASVFRRFWERWNSIAHSIGVFQSRVLPAGFYCPILSPFGLAMRLFSDPLHLKLFSLDGT
jgi:hypothetical protein